MDAMLPDAIVPGAGRFPAPKGLSPAECEHWTAIMGALPANWFGREALPLLRLLVKYLVLADAALDAVASAGGDDLQCSRKQIAADRATAMVLRLSYQLRLTQKSRSERSKKKDETHSRASAVRPWELAIDERRS
jgi:hypothetical protein